MRPWWMRLGVSLFGDLLVPEVPYREGYFLEDAKVVRGEVKLPLVYVGGAASRAAIDEILAAGFEGVAMARALIREPDFVNRLAAEEVRRGSVSSSMLRLLVLPAMSVTLPSPT